MTLAEIEQWIGGYVKTKGMAAGGSGKGKL